MIPMERCYTRFLWKGVSQGASQGASQEVMQDSFRRTL